MKPINVAVDVVVYSAVIFKRHDNYWRLYLYDDLERVLSMNDYKTIEDAYIAARATGFGAMIQIDG